MTAFIAEFDSRYKDLNQMLRELEQLESDAKAGRRLGRRLKAAAIVRASTIVVAYNAIEGSFNGAVRTIRGRLSADAVEFFSATGFWQEELLRHRLLERLRDGIGHQKLLEEVRILLSDARTSAVWVFDDKRLPYSGNVDQKNFFSFCTDIGAKITLPRSAQGGTDLEQIRRDRNDLAHGGRSFSEVGANYTVEDLKLRYRRVRTFMHAALRSLQSYHDGAHFRTQLLVDRTSRVSERLT